MFSLAPRKAIIHPALQKNFGKFSFEGQVRPLKVKHIVMMDYENEHGPTCRNGVLKVLQLAFRWILIVLCISLY